MWESPASERSAEALAETAERSPVRIAIKNAAASPSSSIPIRSRMSRPTRSACQRSASSVPEDTSASPRW